MRNVTEIQQRLIKLGYLAPTDEQGRPNDDGKFGVRSLAAYNRWRAGKGAGPVNAASMAQLNVDLFPEEQPPPAPKLTPNPIVQFIAGLALKAALNQLKGYFPMLNAISGYKTYAVGLVSILIGAADWIGWTIPNTATPSPAGWIVAGLIACFGRAGLAKIAEDVVSKIGGGPAA